MYTAHIFFPGRYLENFQMNIYVFLFLKEAPPKTWLHCSARHLSAANHRRMSMRAKPFNYMGLHKTTWDYMGLHGTTRDCVGISSECPSSTYHGKVLVWEAPLEATVIKHLLRFLEHQRQNFPGLVSL